jgi:DNA polymerase-3 subunit gamma/tau
MENFIVSARKYRPDTFNSVVGQASITATLKNAIKTKQIAHAFLFCGPRGVGKTTCARIFARTINCMNLADNIEACNKCESCKSFNESRAFNIHELDAASNNTVDDMRNLIDQVRIPPQVGKYSIYIVDEVHMLSQAAFNTFLKTLEEPPPYAIFILATTEKHKIIPTILSRCQIYDFNRIKVEDIVSYLEFISKKEGVEYERDAFNLIALKADGAMRDALSIFDQLVNLLNRKITHKGVIESLNILDYDYYFSLTEAFLERDVSRAILIYNEILNNGFDSLNFINGLSNHFRDLLVCKDKQTLQLLEVGNTIKEKYKKQSEKCTPDFIFKALEICSACDIGYRMSINQRLHVELALVKLCNIIEEKKNNLTQKAESPQVRKADKPEAKKTDSPETQKADEPEANKADVPETQKADKPEAKKAQDKEDFISGHKFKSSISIKDTLKNIGRLSNGNNDTGEPESIEPQEPEDRKVDIGISDVMLQSLWNEFAESVKDSMPRMYSTLTSRKPVLSNNGTVELELRNKVQFDDFNSKIKPELLGFLKERSGYNALNIEAKIEKGVRETKKPYTADEKFNYLSEKNPVLKKLKQEFNLDFE